MTKKRSSKPKSSGGNRSSGSRSSSGTNSPDRDVETGRVAAATTTTTASFQKGLTTSSAHIRSILLEDDESNDLPVAATATTAGDASSSGNLSVASSDYSEYSEYEEDLLSGEFDPSWQAQQATQLLARGSGAQRNSTGLSTAAAFLQEEDARTEVTRSMRSAVSSNRCVFLSYIYIYIYIYIYSSMCVCHFGIQSILHTLSFFIMTVPLVRPLPRAIFLISAKTFALSTSRSIS